MENIYRIGGEKLRRALGKPSVFQLFIDYHDQQINRHRERINGWRPDHGSWIMDNFVMDLLGQGNKADEAKTEAGEE